MIVRLSEHPQFAEAAADWCVAHWNTPKAEMLGYFFDSTLPPSLVAVVDGRPVGVLGYRRFPLGNEANRLWLNVLYVEARFRRRGIGRALVSAGVSVSNHFRDKPMLVYTNLPEFYRRLGWQRLPRDTDSESVTLTYDWPKK